MEERVFKHIIFYWILACEDMQIPHGGCSTCYFEKECKEARKHIWKKDILKETEILENKNSEV